MKVVVSAIVGALVGGLGVYLLFDRSSPPDREEAPDRARSPDRSDAETDPQEDPDAPVAAEIEKLLGAPPADVSREDLLTRDEALRRELRRLHLQTPGEGGSRSRDVRPAMLDLAADELRAMADRCEIHFDVPPLGHGNEGTRGWLPSYAG